ncbi:hypothetical protein MTO96_008935 [Rhipicephalus appendiculatus]
MPDGTPLFTLVDQGRKPFPFRRCGLPALLPDVIITAAASPRYGTSSVVTWADITVPDSVAVRGRELVSMTRAGSQRLW